MFRFREEAVLAPAVALALAAVALYPSNQIGAGFLMAAALGTTLGAAIPIVSVRRQARQLISATAQAASGSAEGVGDPRRFGFLAPLAAEFDRLGHDLQAAKEAATTDRLTRVANRPMLLDQLFQEVERAARYSRPLSLAFIDIDHFKPVNDTYGHETGDKVLQAVAAIFREQTRKTDFVGRYGGEEFVLIFPETTLEEATAVAEKLRLEVLKLRVEASETENVGVSVSIGLAGGQGGRHLRLEQLLRDADSAMYSAKSLGRNQTYIFEEIDDDSARIPRAPISPAGRMRAAELGDLARQAAEAALAAAVAPMPHYGGKPSSLIAAIAVRMAGDLDLPQQEVERIRVASQLHDIGKVAVAAQILDKPAPLTPDEWQAVIQHPRIGQVIIDHVAMVRDAGSIILHHHERYSGHGYPYGLRGNDIPLGARIVAIADAYDAMIHDRPYRQAIGHAEAIQELQRHAGMQFDPELVELFCGRFAGTPPLPDASLLIRPSVTSPAQRRGTRRSATA